MSDKGAHFLSYGGLAGALFVALWANRPNWGGLGWRVLAVCAAYGAVDEWTQALPFVRRTCDFHDWLADMGGTLVAVAVLGAVRWAVARRPVEAKMAA
jgi:VanZ family protein